MAANLFTQRFSRELEGNLFAENQYFMRSRKDSNANDEQVNIPVSGSKPGVSVDRATVPATVTQRTDSASFYVNHEFTSDPILIKDSDEFKTNYNKRQDVMSDAMNTLQETIGDYMAYYWAEETTVQQVRTSGGARVATAPSATGDRKALTLADIRAAKLKLDAQNIPQGGRYAVITPAMLDDLLAINEVLSSDFNNGRPMVDGTIGTLFGFSFYVRSSVNVFNNAATPVIKAPGSAGEATDNEAAIFWHMDCVRHSEGNMKLYMDEDRADSYGTIVSSMVRAGGVAPVPTRGIVNVIQAAAV